MATRKILLWVCLSAGLFAALAGDAVIASSLRPGDTFPPGCGSMAKDFAIALNGSRSPSASLRSPPPP
jgi:hypothetical protein